MRASRIRQIKLPVTDLARSARWYRDLLGLTLVHEFEEHGVVRGVVLTDPESGVVVGLRERDHCEGTPRLDGFDVVGFELESVDAVGEFAAQCDREGIERGEVHDRGEFGVAMDIPDPDGTVLRFVAGQFVSDSFTGLSFGDGAPQMYSEPRLPI
jgi:catechol 2,3-dioxygenase-like lactoylglutathione lyase family enzyme